MEAEYDFYPEKPQLAEPKAKGNLALTIFSIVLFILTFLLVFTEEASFVFNLVIVLIIHEMGHFISMKVFGYQHVRMLFIPLMGAFVQGSKEEYSQRQSLIVAGAGPFPGIFIGLLLLYFADVYHNPWMMDLAFLFLLLNIINLIPLDPLDGGQLFKLLIKVNHDLFLLIFTFVSSLVLIGFGWYIDSWVMMAFGFFMAFRVRTIQNQYYLRRELKNEGVNYRTTYKLLSNKDYAQIKLVLLDRIPNLRSFVENVDSEQADPIMASQVNSVLLSPVRKDASYLFRVILILLWLAVLSLPFVFIANLDFFVSRYEWWIELIEAR
ncbi:MAG: site-2 protease family protein [Bacteroidota bacterium]|jgi:Zn-dependent protease